MGETAEAARVRHKMAMDAVGLAAQILTPQAETLAALIEAERRMHSHMHITDPTLYIRALHDKGLAQQVKLARAALAFVLVVREIKAELGEPGP